MGSNKVLNAWAGLSLLFLLVAGLTNWMNHPNLVLQLQHNNYWLFFDVFIVVGLLRMLYLKLPFKLIEGFSISVILSFLTPKFFDKVPTSSSHLKVVWLTVLALSLYGAILLGWEMVQAAIQKAPILKKLDRAVPPMLFALAAVAVCALGLPALYWPFFLFWGLTPACRLLFFRRDPEILKAFTLFFLTDWLYLHWPEMPPFEQFNGAQRAINGLSLTVLVHHFLLSALVFLLWEKLKEAKAFRGRIYLLLYAVLPMLPFYFFGHGGIAWPLQILVLGLLWGWNPWLKPHGKEVFLALGSLAGFYYIQNQMGSMSILLAILALTVLTAQIRSHYLKLPQAMLRALAFYTLGGVAYVLYPLYNPFFATSGNWILACQLILSGLFLVFWERMREHKWRNLRAWIWIYALLPVPIALFNKSLVWPLQVLIIYLTRLYESYGVAEKLEKGEMPEIDWEAKWKILKNSPAYQKAAKFLKKKGAQGMDGLVELSKQKLARRITFGVIGAVAAWFLFIFLYNTFTTHIISFTPMGVVTSENTVIRAKFSDDVQVVSSLDAAFEIEPPLPGSTRLEDSTTLVFTPAAPLKPATMYQVRMNVSGKLKSKQLFLQGSSKTSFSTEAMKVVSSRLFYTYDLVKETEKELVGEIEFNYPVDMNLLRQNLTVSRAGSPLNFELEQGTLPTRFFFKAGGLERTTEPQVLTVMVAPGLSCVDCGKPLGEKYQNTITLPAKPKMLVDEIKLHHVPGNTLISILFSLPASSSQVRDNVTIDPPIPFKVDTEYCYAVLKADFQPNIDYKVHVREGLRAISGEVLEHPSEQVIRLEDIQPYVRFGDSGRLIPMDGEQDRRSKDHEPGQLFGERARRYSATTSWISSRTGAVTPITTTAGSTGPASATSAGLFTRANRPMRMKGRESSNNP